MAIGNHAELVTAVGNYLHRSDLSSMIPDFISLAEAKLNRELRLRAMENIATGTTASSVALPTGFIELIAVTVTSGGNSWPLTYIPPSSISGNTSNPVYYSLVGDNIIFEGSGSGVAYSLTYYKQFDPLSAGVNWLITNAPDLYLYATLLEAAPYINDDSRMSTWSQMLIASAEQVKKADKNDRFGSDLMVKVS
jgi:hypothetical protein